MGLYEGIKDAIGLAQKADTIDLYKQLLDLGAQALDMQAEISKLREENEELKKANELESKIVRHKKPFVTISDDPKNIKYCAICWGKTKQMIQLHEHFEFYGNGTYFECNICNSKFSNKDLD